MGTSVSQRSPDTHNWRAVSASYLSDNFTVERINQEIWRAATNQPTGNLPMSMSEPIIAECLATVMDSSSAEEAARNITRLIAVSGETNLASDIARRAAVTSFLEPGNRRTNFIRSLFSEAVDYLVSRDLSGYVGQGDRIRDVSSSIVFKNDIKRVVERIIDENPAQGNIETNVENWKTYIISQITNLTNR